MDGQTGYNTGPLLQCKASYLGSAVPTKSAEPPTIIEEPLIKICQPKTLRETNNRHVKLHIFHSGILIQVSFGQMNGDLIWYPIQNLYCSAGLQPTIDDRKRKVIYDRIVNIPRDKKFKLAPIFAMVVRETTCKKVLQCHAFSVPDRVIAQELVRVTAAAFQDKRGWNHPLSDKMFLAERLKFSLDIVNTGDDEQLDELHDITGNRDSQIMKMPSPTATQEKQKVVVKAKSVRIKPPPVLLMAPTPVRAQSLRAPPVRVQPLRPPLMIMPGPMPASAPSTPIARRSSKSQKPSYQGFKTDLMDKDTCGTKSVMNPRKSASISGHPLNRTASSGSHHRDAPQYVAPPRSRPVSARQNRSRRTGPPTPRSNGGHRVLASSEPIAMMNGGGPLMNGHLPVMEWDDRELEMHMNGAMNGQAYNDSSYIQQNGMPHMGSNMVINGHKKSKRKSSAKKSSREEPSTSQQNGYISPGDSVKSSKSSYSITKLEQGIDGLLQNGHISSHKDADRAL